MEKLPVNFETRIYIPFFADKRGPLTLQNAVITSVAQLFRDFDSDCLEECVQVMCIEGVNSCHDATDECRAYFWSHIADRLSERGAPFPAFIAADGAAASADHIAKLERGADETASHQRSWDGR